MTLDILDYSILYGLMAIVVPLLTWLAESAYVGTRRARWLADPANYRGYYSGATKPPVFPFIVLNSEGAIIAAAVLWWVVAVVGLFLAVRLMSRGVGDLLRGLRAAIFIKSKETLDTLAGQK